MPHRAHRLFTVIPFMLVLLIAACASLNPVAIAVTPEQKFDAVLLTYNALLEPATQLVEDATAPTSVRRALQNAIGASGLIYNGANNAHRDFLAAKAAVAAGTDTPDKLTIATANLEKWSGQLDGIVAQLQTLTHRN